eukprot:CAMPEP_0197894582 /NCGR_PEP_ID=MMETSP1439-20131203/35903_1 /TAXON_ID=66791 /ORGANISM="Gonyaulax spinifera, Strain CCMP409" /LENGTH=272 /DNA_ID=CAMNT_0043514947 /DNA_START=81 /DNA_END=899 /DNA_ORIENTATION=-
MTFLRTLGAVALVTAQFGATGSLEDEASLVQAKIHIGMRQPELIELAQAYHKGPGDDEGMCRPSKYHGRGDHSAGSLLQSGLVEMPPFNCTAMPEMCQEPFNCQDPPILELGVQIAQNGHPYYGYWCRCWADYLPIIEECQAHDRLDKYLEMTIPLQEARGLADNDASFCFNSGVCEDTEVSSHTTMEEMENVCDERWPGWRSVGFKNLTYEAWARAGLMDPYTRILTPGATEPAAVMAKVHCAIAEIKCEFLACKEHYCKQPKYIEIYRGE